MKIEQVDIPKIIPYEFNSRKHSEHQINQLANSIKEFGFNQPLVIDNTNIILVGHGRFEAAKKLGLKQVPCYRAKDLTEVQKKAYRILDNKLSDDSTWDLENLKLEGDHLIEQGFELEDWGIDTLLKLENEKNKNPEEKKEIKEDDFEPSPIEEINTIVKTGDIVELGRHRVLCGDSTKAEDVERLMDGAKADLLLTDPPYGMSLDVNFDSMFANSKPHIKTGLKYKPVFGDSEYYNPKPLLEMFKAVPEIILFGGDYFCKDLPVNGSWFCWDKRVNEQMDKVVGNCFELAWSKARHKKEVARIMWSGHHGLDTKKRIHPTQKPLRLIAWFFQRIKGDLVCDPFLGSGTTLIAAEQLDRICYGMEISPQYCQVIIDRYFKYCSDNDKEFICKINGEDYQPNPHD